MATLCAPVELEEMREAVQGLLGVIGRLRGLEGQRGAASLSWGALRMLAALDERGELPAGELATIVACSPASATQTLDHLAACGLVVRRRSQEDRRVVVSRLTDEGRARLRARQERWRRGWEERLGDLPPEQLRAAAQVVGRVRLLMEELAEEAAASVGHRPA